MEAISRLYNAHKTKKKFKRLWTEYVQLAADPKSEYRYASAVSRVQPLIDTVAIIKSTEPEFSVVSEETEADATDHFDVTINLLECLSKEVSFEQKDHPESIALHESFYSLLTMLEQCTRSHRYVAKLTISEDNITDVMGLCAAIAHFSIDEVSLWLDVLNFLCSVGFKPAREEAAAYMLCTHRVCLLQTVSDTIMLLRHRPASKDIDESSLKSQTQKDAKKTTPTLCYDVHKTIVSKLLRMLDTLASYLGQPASPAEVNSENPNNSFKAATFSQDGSATKLAERDGHYHHENLCPSCINKAHSIACFHRQCCAIDRDNDLCSVTTLNADVASLDVLDQRKRSILDHVIYVRRKTAQFKNKLNSSLAERALSVTDTAYSFRLVRTFVALLNVIRSVDNSLQAIAAMSELFRQSASMSFCFAFLNGHVALAAMLRRSFDIVESKIKSEHIVTKNSVDVPRGTPKISPDGYINTSPRPGRDSFLSDSESYNIFKAELMSRIYSSLMLFLAALSNCHLDTCSCVRSTESITSIGLFESVSESFLIPKTTDISKLPRVQLLAAFGASNLSIHNAQLLLVLILSGHPSLSQLGSHLCIDLMLYDPANVVTLELSGCVAALLANVKMLLRDDPRMCSGAVDAPWLLEMGQQYTMANKLSGADSSRSVGDNPTESDDEARPGRIVPNIAITLYPTFGRDDLEYALVFILRAIGVVSVVTSNRADDSITAFLVSLAHSSLTKDIYSVPADSYFGRNDTKETTSFKTGTSIPSIGVKTSSLLPLSSYTLLESNEDGDFVVCCQICKTRKCSAECMFDICRKSGAYLTCSSCRPAYCVACHIVTPVNYAKLENRPTWHYFHVDERSCVSFISAPAFQLLRENPELCHLLLSSAPFRHKHPDVFPNSQLDESELVDAVPAVYGIVDSSCSESMDALLAAQGGGTSVFPSEIDNTGDDTADKWSHLVILISSLKVMFDDKLARQQRISSEYLVPLIDAFKRSIFSIGLVPNISISSLIKFLADKPAGDVLSHVISGNTDDSAFYGVTEPPDICQYSLQRIISGILLHCVSRYLVHDRVVIKKDREVYGTPPYRHSYLNRRDMFDRISYFLALGGPALMASLVTGNSTNTGGVVIALNPSASDRHFALWCMREALVASLSLGVGTLAGDIANWLIWLLRCPVHASEHIHINDGISDIADSQLRNEEGLTEGRDTILINPPTSLPIIAGSLRFLVLQEIRIILAGDFERPMEHLDLKQSVNKIMVLCDSGEKVIDQTTGADLPREPSFRSPHALSAVADLLNKTSIFFNVPSMSPFGQDILISYGAVEYLLSHCFGNEAHPFIRDLFERGLSEASPNERDALTPPLCEASLTNLSVRYGSTDLSDFDILNWWSGLGCVLHLLIGQKHAKHIVDCCLGVDRMTGMLIPLVECMGECGLSDFLIDLIAELCLSNGTLCSREALTFVSTSNLPPSQNVSIAVSSQPDNLSFFCSKSKELHRSIDVFRVSGAARSSEMKSPSKLGFTRRLHCAMTRVYHCNLSSRFLIQETMFSRISPFFTTSTIVSMNDDQKNESKSEFIELMSDIGSMGSGAYSIYQPKVRMPHMTSNDHAYSGVEFGLRIGQRLSRSESLTSIVGALSAQSGDPLDISNHSGDRGSSFHSIQGILSALNLSTSNQASIAVANAPLDEFRHSMEAIEITEELLSSAVSYDSRRVSMDSDSDFIDNYFNYDIHSALFTSTGDLTRYHNLYVIHKRHRGHPTGTAYSSEEYKFVPTPIPVLCNADDEILNILQKEIISRLTLFGGPEVWRLCLSRVLGSSRRRNMPADGGGGLDGVLGTVSGGSVHLDSPKALRGMGSRRRSGAKMKQVSPDDKLPWKAVFSNRDIYRRGSFDFLRFIIFKNALPIVSSTEMFKATMDLNKNVDTGERRNRILRHKSDLFRVRFRSVQACELLVSCMLSLSEHYSSILVSVISKLLQDNPTNADVMVDSNMILLLVKYILFSGDTDSTLPAIPGYEMRGRLIQLLSQVLSHSTSAAIIDTIIESTRQGNLQRENEKKTAAGDGLKDDCSRQAFYILGRAVERRAPKCFFSFAGGSVCRSALPLDLVPDMAKMSSPQAGITVSGWVKMPALDARLPMTTTLFQLTTSKEDASSGSRTSDFMTEYVTGVDLFFRLADTESSDNCIFDPDNPEAFLRPHYNGETQSAMETAAANHTTQLCISFHKQKFVTEDSPISKLFRDSQIPYFSPALQQLYARQAFPDVVINFDWSKCSDWSHIAVTFAAKSNAFDESEQSFERSPFLRNGLGCWINGVSMELLYWTPLGYVSETKVSCLNHLLQQTHNIDEKGVKESLPIVNFVHNLGGGSKMMSLGGVHHEIDEYEKCLLEAQAWGVRCDSEEGCNDTEVDEHAYCTGIQLLKTLGESNIGFAGLVCDFCVLAGVPNDRLLRAHTLYGPRGMTLSTLPERQGSSSYLKQFLFMHGLPKVAVACLRERKPRVTDTNISDLTSAYIVGRSQLVPHGSIAADPLTLVTRSEFGSRVPSRSRGDEASHSNDFSDNSDMPSQQLSSTSLVYELLGMFTSQARSAPATPAELPMTRLEPLAVRDRKSVALFSSYDHLYSRINESYGLCSINGAPLGANMVAFLKTNNVADVLPKLKGLKCFFARLCRERRFQVASMRILVALMTANPSLYQEFLDSQVDKLVLFCMCRRAKSLAPCSTATEVLQILFDFVVSDIDEMYPSSAHPFNEHIFVAMKAGTSLMGSICGVGIGESIRKVPILGLLIDIACANPIKPKLARCIGDWLRSVCEDNFENISKVLQTFGLTPFLMMMSVWSIINCEILIDGGISPPNGGVKSEQTTNKRSMRTRHQREAIIVGIDDSVHGNEDIQSRQLPKREYYRLQLTLARLLKQLITGSFGEYNGASVPAQVTTPTGFSVAHLTRLMQFILRAAGGRQRGDSSGNDRLGAISPSMLLNRDEGDSRDETAGLGCIWSTQQRKQQQTDADGDIVPLTWLSHAAQLALEVVIDVVDSPLACNVSHMLKLALPGNDYVYLVLDLMGSSNISIKVGAINLLSLYLCDSDGHVDQKQVAQFEKVGGFHLMSSLLSNLYSDMSVSSKSARRHFHRTEDEEFSSTAVQDLLEALLSLFFWRKRRKYDLTADSAQTQIPPVKPVHKEAHRHISSQESGFAAVTTKNTNRENSGKLMTMGYGYGIYRKEADANDEVDSVGTSETGTTATTNIGHSDPYRNASTDLDDDAIQAHSHVNSLAGPPPFFERQKSNPAPLDPSNIPHDMTSKSSNPGPSAVDESAPSGGNTSGFLSLFGWSGQAAATVEDENSNLQRDTKPNVNQRKTESGKQQHKRELIQIPQVLESVLCVLRLSNHPSIVKNTFEILGMTLREHLDENHDVLSGDDFESRQSDAEMLNRNADAICSQRDWILWLCDMLLTFQTRCRHGTLLGGGDHVGNNVTSMSESESSVGGGYDSEDSTELRGVSPSVGRRSSARDRGCSLSPTSATRRGRQNTEVDRLKPGTIPKFAVADEYAVPNMTNTSSFMLTKTHMLEAYLEPLFSFAQQVFLHDLRCKPISSRKFYDIINRIPVDNPEACQFQMNLLFDILDAASLESFVDSKKSMNVLRNVSALLEQAAERVDIEIDFCVRAVDAMDSLSYNCPAALRAKIRETSLPEMRVLYVTRVLIDNATDIETKASCIRDIHSSIVSMVTSSDCKSLQDVQVLSILLGLLVDACEEIERSMDLLQDMPEPQGSFSSLSATSKVHANEVTGVGVVRPATSLAALASAAAMEAEASFMTRQDALEKYANMREVQALTLELMQDIIDASAECKKYVVKMFQSLDASLCALEQDKGLVSISSLPHGFSRSFVFQAALCNTYNQDHITLSDLHSLSHLWVCSGVSEGAPAKIAGSKESSSPDNYIDFNSRMHRSSGTATTTATAETSVSWWGSWVGSSTTATTNTTSPLCAQAPNTADKAIYNNNLPALELPPSQANSGTEADSETLSASGSLLSQIISAEQPKVTEPVIDNSSFLEWLSQPSNRELRAEIKIRVYRDLKPIKRHADKIQERVVQRRAKSVRYNIERLSKEKKSLLKLANDCADKTHHMKMKSNSNCSRDCEQFLNGLLSRIVIGEGLSWSREDDDESSVDEGDNEANKSKCLYSVSDKTADIPEGSLGSKQLAETIICERRRRYFLRFLKAFREHRMKTVVGTARSSRLGRLADGNFKSLGYGDSTKNDHHRSNHNLANIGGYLSE